MLKVGYENMEEEMYKEKIMERITKINNISTLKYIYVVIDSYLKSRGI